MGAFSYNQNKYLLLKRKTVFLKNISLLPTRKKRLLSIPKIGVQ